MKVFKLSVNEIVKNKIHFTYFVLGLALLLSVICVLNNYSNQIFESFFSQFERGDFLSLSVKKLPLQSEIYRDMTVFARGSGLTYDVTLLCEDKSVILPSYRGGVCIISEGTGFPFPNSDFLNEGDILIVEEIANELDCKIDDLIIVNAEEYKVQGIILRENLPKYLSKVCSFVIYRPDADLAFNEINIIVPDTKRLLELSLYLNEENYTDNDGLLILCNNYRGLKAGVYIVIILLITVCATYIFIFIKIYLSKQKNFLLILLHIGISQRQLYEYMGLIFILLFFLSSALGFLISVLLDEVVAGWALELLNTEVDAVRYNLYFSASFIICLVFSLCLLIPNIIKLFSSIEEENR